MLPLREELLREFSAYSTHSAVRSLTDLLDNPVTAPDKVLLLAGDFGQFDPNHNWSEYVRVSAKSKIPDIDKYNRDIADWVREVNAFVRVSDARQVFKKYSTDYALVVDDIIEMADNGRVISSIVSDLGFNNARIYVLPSVMINPGRNYGTECVSPSGELIGFFRFGPYKQVPQSMFRARSFNEAPVSFNDRQQFVELCLHEMTHLLLSQPLFEGVGGREAEYEDFLKPLALEETLKSSYGEVKGHAYYYLEELITRAFTLEYVRRYVGEAAFRQLAAREVGMTRGYAVLLWRYLYRNGLPTGDRKALVRLLAGIPQEMQSWNAEEVAAFSRYNEDSCTLADWTGTMLPMFYQGNPQSFRLVFDERLPAEWRTQFTGLLNARLGLPADMQVSGSEDACPFPLVVRLDSEEQFAQRLSFSGMDLAAVRKRAVEATGKPDPLLFTIILEPKPDRSGVRLCWDVLADAPPPAEKLVPYYIVTVTHILAADDAVLALDSLTRETRLISTWLK
jgi:hypothetical protein